MSISWGAWDYGNSSAGFRVGVEYSISSVNNGSSSVTFTTDWYVEAMYNVNDLMTVTYGGSISGSSEQNLTTGGSGGVKHWGTKTYTYTYSTYGSSPGTRTFSGALSGVYNGANPSKSITLTIPARPYATPAAPTNVVGTRNDDTQNTITWTRNATTGAPYTSLTVQQRKWTGSAWSSWSTIATTSSTATSYVDTGNEANAVYQYQVRANNSAGSSAYVQTAELKNTPAAPTGVTATLQPSGTAIALAWTDNHYTGKGNLLKIQRSVAGGAYADLSGATALAETVTSFTDNAPGAGTNAYRVYAYNGSLTSTEGQSNTVSTTVAPLAPTNLSPNGVARDVSQATVLTWQHNPGGDQAAQTAYTVEWSTNGGANWTTMSEVVSSASTATISGGTWTNGQSILWRVKTKGVSAAGYGPVSASATITGSATPTTAITAPPATVTTLPMTATWTYSQGQSSAQAAWELELSTGGQVVEFQSGTGTTLTRPLAYAPTSGTYLLRQRSQSAAGLWSAWATRTLTISLSPPAHTTVTAEYQPTTGTVVLDLVGNAPGGGEVAIASVTIARRVPGGPWVTLATGITLPNDFVDLLPATQGTNEYLITSVSATPTYRDETIVQVTPPDSMSSDDAHMRQWIFVNYGDAFTNLLRLRSSPRVSVVAGRDKSTANYLGRTKPVPQIGNMRSRQVNAEGDLVYDHSGTHEDDFVWDSPPRDWETAGQEAEVVCFRDYTGRRVFGLLSAVGTAEQQPGLGAVSFEVTETEWVEVYA